MAMNHILHAMTSNKLTPLLRTSSLTYRNKKLKFEIKPSFCYKTFALRSLSANIESQVAYNIRSLDKFYV